MGTTPNFAIPYPEPTDFVADGATAMENIAEKVDDILSTGTPAHNLLINGAMQVAQRSTSVAGITVNGYYTADRFITDITTMGTWTQSVENDAPTGSGFRKSLKMLCTTADASPAADDLLCVRQRLEGQNIQQFAKGTSSAKQFALSFWVKSNVTGTYIVELRDIDNTRFVSASYTVAVSATWEKKTIIFPADTTGAFDNNNDNSLEVSFGLGSGSNRSSGTLQTTWASVINANRYVGQVNLAGATNNYWQMTGAQLTVGATDVPFQFKSFADELAECQRYYSKSYSQDTFAGAATFVGTAALEILDSNGTKSFTIFFPVTMRAAPTITGYSPTSGVAGKWRIFNQARSLNQDATVSFSPTGENVTIPTIVASGVSLMIGHWIAQSEL